MKEVWHFGDLKFKSITTIFFKYLNNYLNLKDFLNSTLGHYCMQILFQSTRLQEGCLKGSPIKRPLSRGKAYPLQEKYIFLIP